MSERLLVVCGCPRCGSSLTMQALQAGGFPCVGEYPAFENEGFADPIGVRENAEAARGKAVKILDPQRNIVPMTVPADFILLSRNPIQQAKSNLKFIQAVGEFPILPTSQRKFAESFGPDLEKARRLIRARRDARLLEMSFEGLITTPRAALERVARWIEETLGRKLDVERMVALVEPRSTDCLPDMELELRLIERSHARP